MRPYRGKRLFDIVISALALTVTSPFLVVIAIAVRWDSPGPIFFRQDRVGEDGRIFQILKFRTMYVRRERGPHVSGTNDPRITPVGRVLRRWYLDEIPQFANVLKGDMSVVGPRPETPRYVAVYGPDQRRILDVRPGIIGPAGIIFRHEEAILAVQDDPEAFYVEHLMPARIELDLEYVDRQSLLYDLGMLFRVVLALFRRSTPIPPGDSRMPTSANRQ